MEKSNTVKILEVCKITPCNPNSSDISLPVTPFDRFFMNFARTKRLFYYKLTDSDPPFLDSIIPKLKQSLSVTLQHFLPLSGNFVWPEDSAKPFILYTPNDSVSFIVAEIHDSDFNHLSGNHPHEIKQSEVFIPSVEASDLKTPLMAIQVTKFPNNDGFSIGISCHHVIFDGKSMSIFMKAWSHICKLNESSLPESLTPSFDRSEIQNPSSDFIPKDKFSLNFVESSNNLDSNLFYGTFELTRSNIEKLRKRVLLEYSSKEENNLHLSSFVVAYAYALMCLIKAKNEDNEGNYFLTLLTADIRNKDPSFSSNYVGNCLAFAHGIVQGKEFADDENSNNAFPNIAKKISDLVLELKNDGSNLFLPHKPSHEVENSSSSLGACKICSIASSPNLKFYDTDFGFGKPKKIEFVSLGDYNISITETRDGGYGDIEISILLPSHEMNVFASLFSNGLN